MKDVTGKEIESGDFLLEMYNGYTQLHVAFNGFTPLYVRTIIPGCYYSIQGGYHNNFHLWKTRVKPRYLIVLTEEQMEHFVEARLSMYTEQLESRHNISQQELNDSVEYIEKSFNSIKEFSRLLKEEGDITELLTILAK